MAHAPTEPKLSNVTPCTISMLNKLITETNEFYFKDQPIELIELLAKVREMRETALRYEFTLYDCTGTYTAYSYKNVNKNKSNAIAAYEFVDNAYALIYGSMRFAQDNASLMITRIQNIKERSVVDEFLSRVVLGYVKTHKPVITSPENNEVVVYKTISKAGFNQKGFTSQDVKQMLNGQLTLAQVEEALSELLMNGKLKNGFDWNHYMIK